MNFVYGFLETRVAQLTPFSPTIQSCQDHTTGDFCEICEDGYMPDVNTYGRHSCRPCACPLSIPSNNQTIIGNHLASSSPRCAPGFYGNPMVIGDSCKRCDCNGNSDPNHIFNECHNVTGFCQNCWGDTAGANCERCAPGFYGDAISAKNCRGACPCSTNIKNDSLLFGSSLLSGCDECIWHLIGDLRLSNKTLDQVKVSVLNISTGAAANDRLKYYNYTAHRLQVENWTYPHESPPPPMSPRRPTTVRKTRACAHTHIFDDVLQKAAFVVPFVCCSVLRHVRQLEKKLISTEGRVAPIREVLSRFTKKLSEAQDILQKAANTVQETEDMNKANTVKFQRSEVTSHNPGVRLAQTVPPGAALVLAPQMSLNVTEYHAAIDGASKLLQEKTEALSLADRDLVQRAQDHAKDLQSQADELEYDLKRSDANGFVQKALDAANVYNNIVQYIEEANITGLTTLDLATRAEDVGCLKCTAVSYLSYIQELSQVKHILVLDHSLSRVSDMHIIVFTAIPRLLSSYREVAEGTLNRSVEVLQTITPIHEKVEEWATNMKNQDYSAAAFDRAVVSAGEAVENLSELVPELLDKLRVIEKKPVNNVTTNIMRIRELIAQARSVAKKVQVSMKFNGQSSVEVQPHINVADLKTVTTISLFIRVDPDKDPIEDRFIFYLGDRNGKKDYMGLAIKNDNLVYIYNLGGEDVEIPLGSKPVSQWPPVFNLIKVERLGRHGKVFLTVPSQTSTDEQKFIQKGEAFGTDSLFNLDPEDTVFFVGGVPADVRLPPALSLAPFVGCIELASLNNDVISLYNFKQTHKMDVVASTPCPRYKLAFSQSRIASYLFDGTGYALINNMERRGKFGIVTRFDIAVRTVANNGILLLMVTGDNFFLLELKNGFLRLMYDFGFSGGPIVMESNLPKLQINDARYHEVSVIYHYSKKIILLVDKSHVKSMENEKKTLPFSDIYIGGAPSHILLSRPELSSLMGLKGCVKGFQFQKKDFNLLEEPGTIGISSGCPEESFMSRKAYFTGESYLGSAAKISPFDAFEGGLNFRTLQPTGLLFYHIEGSDEFTIALENGAVVLNSRGTRVKSQKKQYNDGMTHFLKRPSSPASASTVRSFYLGGSPSSSIKNFTGCISYAYISRQDRDIEPEDFQKYTENVQTSLQDCPVERPPAALLSKHSKNSKDKSNQPQGLLGLNSDDQEPGETEETPCYLSARPHATRHAHHYGGIANSRQEYTDIPESHFSLSLKTQSSFGLIFYASDEAEDNYMALFLSHGKLVYTFNLGQQQVKVKSPEKYNDGTWHNVIFIRDGNLGRLIIDGLTLLEDRAQGSNVSWHISSTLYVGGVPPGRAQQNILRNSAYSFTGCVKNFQLNGQWLSSVSQTFGVTPCFEGLSEPGTYFSEEGGYVVLDDTFNLGRKFELVVEVRPRVASGVLLHVYAAAEEYLTMYIHQGAVVVLVNNGVREFFTQVTPRLGLCDGSWHRITVIRDANVIQLDVDSDVNHVVGPLHPSTQSARAPVFIGGAPESLLPEGIATRRAYTGCMRNLTVNESQVAFSKAALVSGSVSVGSCPAA
uniref:Laminin subunit alpha-4-like n=1 Tax=Salmo trutta TaxID=8032 RepID=A0A674D3I5_SALTR